MPVNQKDVQRLFLQAVFSRGVLSGKLAQTLWEKAKETVQAVDEELDIAESDWDTFVTEVNDSLNALDLEFRHVQDETTGRIMYAIANRKDDTIAQMAGDYAPVEISFFKAVVEQIMLAPRESYSISSLAALREVSALKPKSNMSKTQAEVVLSSFVAKGWLLKSKRGRYSLSARALLELSPYLKSTYPEEILECVICYEMMTKGVACPSPNCKVRMHFHCFTKYSARSRQCTTCKKDWPPNPESMTAVGEAALRDGEDGKRRVRRPVEDSDEEEDTGGDNDDDEPSQPSQPDRKSKSHQEANMDVDEDDDEEDSDTPVKRTRGSRKN
ncbi:Nse1 non-SMC component of SMC5-6 complex-domain-containing protein [Mycena pura]|uniref:Non-structural maintenance of chromosomes element 1 homolog n=1 Tax=Mycena pura TaxID=153505 RepID=A0AAD6VPJ5_9AGAR|nr:Nse1 non-SMC component of SMC5-6 complex-domain-containing protein [Mycena pura]